MIKRDELAEEVNFVEQYLEGLDFPCANTHDDFHLYNIIYDDSSGRNVIITLGCNKRAKRDLCGIPKTDIQGRIMLTSSQIKVKSGQDRIN